MKIILTVLIASLFSFSARAQVHVNASVNIGTMPVWIPAGYEHVNYYYIPTIETYYSVPHRVYVYRNGNGWIRSASLPRRYRNYNLHHSQVVVINHDSRPYLHHSRYQKQYRKGYGRYEQHHKSAFRAERYYGKKNHSGHGHGKKKH